MGGGFALLLANRGFDASAPNYGLIPKDPREALHGACPIVASFGERDRGLKDAAGRLESTLTELGVEHDVKEYPGAGHSFMNRHNAGVALSHLERVAGFSYHGRGRLVPHPVLLPHPPRRLIAPTGQRVRRADRCAIAGPCACQDAAPARSSPR